MNWLHTILMLLAAYLLVFWQSAFSGLRDWVGAQPDFLPGLVVYLSLSAGMLDLLLFSIAGGLCFDSLSANPLGVSVLPLFLAGFVLRRYRGVLQRNQLHAQWMLGAAAHAAVPLMSLLLLWSLEQHPLVGWFSLWQGFVVVLLGTALTPIWFRLFDRLARALSYQPADYPRFRLDREIKRGRF